MISRILSQKLVSPYLQPLLIIRHLLKSGVLQASRGTRRWQPCNIQNLRQSGRWGHHCLWRLEADCRELRQHPESNFGLRLPVLSESLPTRATATKHEKVPGSAHVGRSRHSEQPRYSGCRCLGDGWKSLHSMARYWLLHVR